MFHGFLRARDGAITTFDAPGAGNGAGQGTFPATADAINRGEEIVGSYKDARNVYHAFLRAPDGAITTFSARGAGKGAGQGTSFDAINDLGAITGDYLDARGVDHGFLRAPGGTITIFNVRAAGTASGQGTTPENINRGGAIIGTYVDARGVNHGFLRASGGAITTFDAPGAGTKKGQGTTPFQNNALGVITGFYIDARKGVSTASCGCRSPRPSGCTSPVRRGTRRSAASSTAIPELPYTKLSRLCQ